MKKVEIELFRYHGLLFGRVLHIDDELRNKGTLISGGAFAIHSRDCPYLDSEGLYLRGANRDKDNNCFSYNYDTEALAIAKAERIKDLIDKLNGDTEASESPVERIM